MATAPDLQPGRIYSFGPFELAERAAELRKNGRRVKLQEQPYQVLIELVANAGEVVTREELQQKLWPADTFVDFDVGLNSAVRKLRQALGDDADHPRYIETLAKRGYRFIASVTEASSRPAVPAPEPPLMPVTKLQLYAEEPPPTARRTQVIVATVSALVLAVLGFLGLRFGKSATPHFITEQRLTSNPEENPVIGAVISPDGKYLAYADSTGVYFRQIDNGETHALPTPKGKDWVPTSWYPDSTHLILSSWSAKFTGPEWFAPDAHPSIWAVSILGGYPQKLVEDATEGILSPDGSQIAFLRGGAPAYPRQIWWGQTASENATQALASTSPLTIVSSIAWSPHGKRVAYIRSYTEAPNLNLWALETLDVRTHRATTLKVSSQFSGALCWAPDGRVLYSHTAPSSEDRDIFGVFAQPVNENTGASEGKDVHLTDGPGVIGGMSISMEGPRLALWRVQANPETFISDIDPRSQKLQPMRRLTLDQNINVVSAWTSDSRFVLFNSNRKGGFKVYRQALDQTVPELLVDGHSTGIIRLSPDGTHLLFTVDNSLSDGEDPSHPKPASVMRVPVDGGSPQKLFELPRIGDIQCARSPSKLCLLDTWSPEDIFSFDADTGKRQPVSLGGKFDREEWSLSPDGSTLALILKDRRLTFIDLSTRKAHEVTVGEWKQLYAVDWAPDSKSVYIPSRRPNGEYVLLRVEPNGSRRIVLEGGKTPRFQWAIPSPDGKHVAVQAITGENNVWMIEHF